MIYISKLFSSLHRTIPRSFKERIAIPEDATFPIQKSIPINLNITHSRNIRYSSAAILIPSIEPQYPWRQLERQLQHHHRSPPSIHKGSSPPENSGHLYLDINCNNAFGIGVDNRTGNPGLIWLESGVYLADRTAVF
ncbi:hypothetical protein TNCT_457301 [Trichonephila clavata]|uniref:Uncharacterized protein n=1 Tax=Trichonephila clavata TaxID=2740835 RepID=A0A8X6J214_TRICU|nr:hypothetical protein TNCT_457301 [Trichonephila clavata]